MSPPGIGPVREEPVAPAPPAPPAAAGDDYERLRELLLGDERRALDAARARLAELEHTQRDLPQRLPAALEALQGEADRARVAKALAEPVATALGTAVRRNRQSLIDALFPIIGPLIRKSIAEALRNLVADLNGAIESSFTLRGLKWRFEAWRGGVPYAQIVLKHRLAYRIDHVFLIDRESGLVLHHEAAPELPPLDADAIAGMLTALGDFVDDSVGQGSRGALDSAQVGEYLVWVEHGPRANLACFMRGVPPAALHALLDQRLEEIHAQLPALAPGEAATLGAGTEGLHETLRPAALQLAADAQDTPARRAPSRWPLLVALLAALVALTVYVARRERWDARIEALRARLAAHPGFVLTGIDAQPWRAATVHGLLDPDAMPLRDVLASANLGNVVPRLETGGYLSADDATVARRARRLLAPPPGVELTVVQGTLHLRGDAPEAWIAVARERAAWIAGVAGTEIALQPQTDAVAAARAELEGLVHALAALHVSFVDGTQAASGADAVVDDIVRAARRAQVLAGAAKVELAFVSVGSNDETGGDEVNARRRAARAQWLVETLGERGLAGVQAGGADLDPGGVNRRAAYLRLTLAPRSP